MLFRTRQRLIALFLFLMPLASGCGDSGGGGAGVPDLTQQEADDLAQVVGVVTATDNGGWMSVVASTVPAMPTSAASPAYGAAARDFRYAAAPSPGNQVLRDTSIFRANMRYDIKYLYADTSGADSIDTWTPSSRSAEIISTGRGSIQTASDSAGFEHHGQGKVSGLFGTLPDTLLLDGFMRDSMLVRMNQVILGGTRFYNVTIDTDYDLGWDRGNNPALPLEGSASFSVLLERLNSFNPNDPFGGQFVSTDGTVTILFDGTQSPLVQITNDPDEVQFRYRINLRTGTITRVP